MAVEDGDIDRWGGNGELVDEPPPSSSSPSRKSKKGERKSSKREKDGGDRDGHHRDEKSRSSKHSKDKDKAGRHTSSSSSRKRDRSEDRSGRDRSRDRERSKDRSSNTSKDQASTKDRSKNRSRDRNDDGDDEDGSGHKRRRRDEKPSSSSRDKGHHKESKKDRGSKRDGDRDKDKRRKESKHHKDKDKDRDRRSGRSDGKGTGSSSSRRGGGGGGGDDQAETTDERRTNGTGNGSAGSTAVANSAEVTAAADLELADGEEEGELIFEPKKVEPTGIDDKDDGDGGDKEKKEKNSASSSSNSKKPASHDGDDHHKKSKKPASHDDDDHHKKSKKPASHDDDDHHKKSKKPASHDDDDHHKKSKKPASHDDDDHHKKSKKPASHDDDDHHKRSKKPEALSKSSTAAAGDDMETAQQQRPPSPPPPEDPAQAEEAARIARIAARAEERAAERARARAGGGGASSSRNGSARGASPTPSVGGGRRGGVADGGAGAGAKVAPGTSVVVAFKTKKQREQEALLRLEQQRRARRDEQDAAAAERGKSERQRQMEEEERRKRMREQDRQQAREQREKEKELEVLRNQYLGVKKQKKKIVKPSEKFSKIFQFDWDASEDTSRDANPLYNQRAQLNASFGRGYLAGIDMREQRKDSAFLTALMQKRQEEQRRLEEADTSLTAQDRVERERAREEQLAQVEAISRAEANGLGDDPALKGAHWSQKPLSEMGERDWRIFREDFDIRVKGGKAPLPLRFWEEGNLPPSVMEAIRDLGYEKPSPIQRQAIPIGMERRDIIGIAETGSGKTAAFGIPMISYILALEPGMRKRVGEQGPLALIMAPTRELAIQIEEECIKFCKYANLKTVCVVGGQDIEAQAFTLRKGVEIIIGTPGRLNDCVEKHYLVLNQCNYVVLDEADRMIDMGFEEQVLAVLEAMGGTLKADDEQQAYQQEKKAKAARTCQDLVRVTAMFSATMPPAVEKMAKKYLRHPAVVQIGDEDTGKNRRIEQRVLWMTETQKKTRVVEILRSHSDDDRVLVFINTKKNADMLGRQLEQAGFKTGVLHGGKTQDQREENLEMFRDGDYTVLVATDVASRGLDIPDVKEVINYELPSKIETYCHRIGRTGRAGKDGIATSFLTEHDEEIMFGLREYLQSTESHVPEQLKKHSAAQAAVGTRRDDGTLVNSKRDAVQYSKK